ncbi:sugar transporter [Clavulina sp. PMI_390]|nr:sugar transporter [Clavulina sp. PMI_390]
MSVSDVKDTVSHDSHVVSSPGVNPRTLDDEFGGPEARAKLEKSLLWKVDARMSILVVIYILNYVDRNNASAARLRGLEKDLKLTGQQFPTLLSILYVGYILFQVPSNMFLNKIGKPSLYIPACMVLWGMISTLTGVTTNFTGAVLTRFFLGVVEAAFFPGALFMLSKWYTRKELGLRTAILYCGNLISNAFGNLLAAGVLSNMDGKLGHAAWRWLFFIEGALTMFVAVCAIFILPDFPATTSWLSLEERRLAEARMAADVGESDSENTGAKKGLWLALTDWKVWWLSLALTAQVIGLSFNQYFPTLTKTLGYSTNISLLLCAPPWAFATIIAFVNARHSDKTGEKFFHIVTPLFFGIIGFVIALATTNKAARYISLFLMAQSYAGFIVFYSWLSHSIPRPPAKRAVALAFINAFSQLGNISGSYCFPSNWGPTYRKSYGILLANMSLGIIMSFIFRQHLISLNKRMDRGEYVDFGQGGDGVGKAMDLEGVRRAAELEGITEEEARKNRETFRYLY